MMAVSRSPDDPAAALGSGVTWVTATQRLARYLHAAHDEAWRSAGRAVWETPDILPWSAWLQRCWETGLMAGIAKLGDSPQVLLNAHQEQLLWEQAIESVDADTSLLQVPATARAAREAWELAQAWRLSLPEPGPFLGDDVSAFLTWEAHYRLLCRQAGWLDAARLPDAVAVGITDGAVPVPDRLLVSGFDELTPQQTGLLEALESAGCLVEVVGHPERKCAARRLEPAGTDEEIRAAASWARRILETAPDARIGIVAPDLRVVRDRMERILDDILVPPVVLGASADRPYNLSLGRPLAASPPIHSALMALELAGGPLELQRAGSLLRTPFLAAGGAEMSRRALLDARLRSLGEPRVTASGLRAHARGSKGDVPHASPVLAERLDRLLAEPELVRSSRPASRWAESFARILAILGWPGERTLDSAEYQATRAWRQLLASLSSLDAVAGRLDYSQALARLRRMAAGTPFQPRSPDVPVQVLGVLEAAGMAFDHLWVMGLQDEVWPGQARPSPFLPLEMQRARGLPHASAERELSFARRVTGRLLASADHVVVSSPRSDAERMLRPSPLIAGIPLVEDETPALSEVPAYASAVFGTAKLESIEHDPAPVLVAGGRPAGGAAIFRDQAACPFRAFAAHRLGAAALEPVCVGLDPRARGVLVHEALAAVWSAIETHERLCRLPGLELAAIVRESVQKAVNPVAHKRPDTFTERFRTLECRRLERLLGDWMELEKRRAPFRVELSEACRETAMGGVPVRLRLDRLDRLAGGGSLVIDYKTGRSSVSRWFGERPDEPQMPLYAVTSEGSVEAVLFAQLRPGELRFNGISRGPALVPGVKELAETPYAHEHASWEALEDAWRESLTRLGEAFRDGHAAVDPKRYPETCGHCGFGPLCRIHERLPGRLPSSRAEVPDGG